LDVTGRQHLLSAKIKQLSTKQNGRKTTAIQDKTGTLLTEPKAVLNKWKEYVEELGYTTIIRFADDHAMTASSEEGLQRIMEALQRISEEYRMCINLKKTEVMMFTKGQPKKVSIWPRNTELEQVHEFCCLGSLLTEDARCDKEIKKRIAMAKTAFMRRGELLRGNLSKDVKKRMVKAVGTSTEYTPY